MFSKTIPVDWEDKPRKKGRENFYYCDFHFLLPIEMAALDKIIFNVRSPSLVEATESKSGDYNVVLYQMS